MISLLSLIRTPEERQFMERLFLEHEELMYCTARRYAHDRSLCGDIVHDSLEQLIRKIHVLRDMDCCTLRVYIVHTVRNTAYTAYRKSKVRCKHEEHFPEWQEEPVDPRSLDGLHLTLFNRHRLSAAWEKLSEQDQILLYGKYLMDLSDKELSAILVCTASSIRMMLTRARRALAKHITELEDAKL